MKRREPLKRSPEPPSGFIALPKPDVPAQPSANFFLTDSVLDELKRQSTGGCLLCSLDELDTQDWD